MNATPQARQQCIKHHGTKCVVCDFDFLREYGVIGNGYIQVHHLIPIHEKKGKEYEIDPDKDMIPICLNYHAMIHRGGDMLSIDELRQHDKNAQTSKKA